jgi:hypothetical protein
MEAMEEKDVEDIEQQEWEKPTFREVEEENDRNGLKKWRRKGGGRNQRDRELEKREEEKVAEVKKDKMYWKDQFVEEKKIMGF